MLVHGHPPAVVRDADGTILVQNYFQAAGVARNGFIDAVVDDFLNKMIGAGGIGIHARALAHRVQAGQNFNIGGRVAVTQS